jgi:hypothetical protein
MKPERVGRKVGVGMRVASGMLRDRATQTAHSMQQQAPVYAERARVAKREGKRFGERIWGPFAHAGSVLWLEVTGLFFGLFCFYFAQNAFKLRHEWHAGPEHTKLIVYCAIALVFLYFAFSSFLGARRKEKLKRKAQAASR